MIPLKHRLFRVSETATLAGVELVIGGECETREVVALATAR
jgi:hypothetical protein